MNLQPCNINRILTALGQVSGGQGSGRTSQQKPIVILDVDLTLVDNEDRTRAILRDYVQSRPMPVREKSALLEQVARLPIEFSIAKNLAALGVPADEVQTTARAFWQKRFFSDRYLHYDIPYPGAVEAVQTLISHGALVAYVTGRIASTMAAGTVREFLHHGFPVATTDTMLILKADPTEDDTAFKIRALETLLPIGQPVWLLDNEPRICNAWFQTLNARTLATADKPWSVTHRVTRHSPGAPPLEPGIDGLTTWVGENTPHD